MKFIGRKVAEKIRGCGMFDGNEGWDAKNGSV
jgi:hypothetical protein